MSYEIIKKLWESTLQKQNKVQSIQEREKKH